MKRTAMMALATALVLLGCVVFTAVGARILLSGEPYGGGLIFASGAFFGWWLAGGYRDE